MAEVPNIRIGTFSLEVDAGWLRLNTWKEGLLAKMGHDLVINAEEFEVQGNVTEDGKMELEVDVPKGSLQAVQPIELRGQDKRDIHKNIQKHLPSDIRFEGTLVWENMTQGNVEGTLTLGKGSTSLAFPVVLEGNDLVGKVSFSQTSLGLKPFKAPLGVLRVKDEIDVSFEFSLEELLY